MTQFSIYLFIAFIFCFPTSFLYSQNWTKQFLKEKPDSLLTIYKWEQHDDYHAAGGEIILTKAGRFKYSAYFPFNKYEYSSGDYKIIHDTLILTSDFQSDNMKVDITYADTSTTNALFRRLSFPKNLKGDILSSAYYFINNDTTIKGHYDPMGTWNLNLLDSIKNLQVKFYDTDCGSAWITVNQPNKFIQVTILTDINLDEAMYKTLNSKFKMTNNKLISLSDKK
jgi:hypothetical protein